ncbi:hypothetical protein [Shewanella putrefaciens]|uniref:Uncharacterized protein n=1 Tax=Shewanella putrefaciens (strain CN-32 / ATCC BAA-453) TaxID=319224 RepID=A4YCF5_SHEPC|nr:hypothetical protein [Shewanella putrefaciens]QGS48034.1 hypothetical protein FOB89_03465 [Shewanella putrefaciens]CAD6365206.1 hypothetical protein SHEWT2_03419 [Shewanella hafniensis]
MGSVKGVFLDSALFSFARDIIALQKSGLVIDVNQSVQNWNEKHKIAADTVQLQNDVALFVEIEQKRQLSSVSALGLASYKVECYAEKAKELMSAPIKKTV